MSVAAKFSTVLWLSVCLVLSACGGGGGGSSSGGDGGPNVELPGGGDGGGDGNGGDGDDNGNGTDDPDAPEVPQEGAPTVTVDSPAMKQLRFSWNAQEGDEFYRLSQDVDGVSGFTEVAEIEGATEFVQDVSVHRINGTDGAYIVEACNAAEGCVPSLNVSATEALINAIGYIKASNTGAGDEFGQSIAISDDGKTIAIGAHNEESMATGINGDQADNSIRSAGAVYVFAYGDAGWAQQAYIKASDIASDDDFGHSLDLSADGNTLVVGAPWEENTKQSDHHDTGAVYVYTRSGSEWSEQQYLHAPVLRTSGHFGVSVSVSDDGNLMAVGAYGKDGTTTAPDGEATGDTTAGAVTDVPGVAHLFQRTEGAWNSVAVLEASNTEDGDMFGHDVILSGDGSTLVVGAYREDGAAATINGDGADNTVAQAGAAYVFGQTDGVWGQQAYLKSPANSANAYFGFSLAISDDGNTLAVGASEESEKAGAAHIFSRADGVWTHQARLTGSNTDGGDNFGTDLVLNNDGSLLVVGASFEDSTAMGVGGSEGSNTGPNSGAIYVFEKTDAEWIQTSYVKAPNTQAQSNFGHSVALDGTGATLAVGAIREDGGSVGVDGDQANQLPVDEATGDEADTGAVYLY